MSPWTGEVFARLRVPGGNQLPIQQHKAWGMEEHVGPRSHVETRDRSNPLNLRRVRRRGWPCPYRCMEDRYWWDFKHAKARCGVYDEESASGKLNDGRVPDSLIITNPPYT